MIHHLYNFFLTLNIDRKRSYFFRRLDWRLYVWLKKRLSKYYRNKQCYNYSLDNSSDIVVSLTSFPSRIDTVDLVVKSIFNQTCKPNKILLYLGLEFFPNEIEDLPDNLKALLSSGLEVRFRQDLKPHTKYYYAFQEFSDFRIVTVDDDLIYPINMLEKLIYYSKLNPQAVIANRVREISFVEDEFNNYREWEINKIKHSCPSYLLLATGVGGVLYNPGLFSKNLYNRDKIIEIALNVDDIWLKANQIESKIPVVFTNYFLRPFIEIPESQRYNLHSNNVFSGNNDLKISEIFNYFNINKDYLNKL